jgi:DNA polymerase-4
MIPASLRPTGWWRMTPRTSARRNALQDAIDSLNSRYAKSLVTQGVWTPPPGGYAGGKIAFTRIPYAEDFW